MLPLNILIVDDEPVAVRRLQSLLRGLETVSILGTAGNADDAMAFARRHSPDLVLLDIEMPGIDGISAARELRKLPSAPAVIFVTAFSRFALDAFDLAAAHYLLKPVEAPRLKDAIERVRAQRMTQYSTHRVQELEELVGKLRAFELGASTGNHEGLWLSSRQGRERVRLRDILWIKSERDYVHIRTEQKTYFARARLKQLEKTLDGQGIVRVHRSAMVRASAISRIERVGDRGHRLILADETVILASRRFAMAVRQLISEQRTTG